MGKRWARWADARASKYQQTYNTSIAPIWLSGRTPWLAGRMWLSEQIRHRGDRTITRLSNVVWPGARK